MPTYDPTIPLATQPMADTQQPIQDNYAEGQTVFALNHGTFGGPIAGKHTVATFQKQAAVPSAVVGQIALFSSAYSKTANATELWSLKHGGTNIEIPWTAQKAPAAFTVGANTGTRGWTFLPTGELMKYGTLSWGGAGSNAVPLDASGEPTFANVFTIAVTPKTIRALLSVVNFSTSDFSVSANISSAITISWLVMGMGVR